MYIQNFPDEDSKSIQLRKAIHKLNEKGVLSDELLKQFENAFMVRNQSVHNAGRFDKSAVVKATDSILDIITKIQSLHY